MFITLAGFIAGSVVGAAHWDFWVHQLPVLEPIFLPDVTGGYFSAWLVQMMMFAVFGIIVLYVVKKKSPPPMAPVPTDRGWKRILRGSWPLMVGALLLAVLNALTLLVKGSPWGITSAFALWGSKIAMAMGIDVTSWAYWAGDRGEKLTGSLFADSTSVMNFGIITGAFIASAIGGVFGFKKVKGRVALASFIGGLLMGYGARLATGCNIGAFFSAIASFSGSGWVWMVVALLGIYVGNWLRPAFGLSVPKPTDSRC